MFILALITPSTRSSLVWSSQFTRCLLSHFNQTVISKLPTVYYVWRSLPIYGPSVWFVCGTLSIHKVPFSVSTSETSGHPCLSLHSLLVHQSSSQNDLPKAVLQTLCVYEVDATQRYGPVPHMVDSA